VPPGWFFPGGAEVRAPTPADPRWRGAGGRPHSLSELVAGQSPQVRDHLLHVHAEAIGEIVRSAVAANLAGESARALVAAASRLLRELIGQA